VDTSFLPDKARDERITEATKKLKEVYMKNQESVKGQIIEVKYTYWDGTNIVKSARIPKDTKISIFLEIARKELLKDYADLRYATGDGLMFVLQDYIVPLSATFYEIMITRVEGKGGLLLDEIKNESEDVYEIISPPGKIVEKRWYEKNKHIYPCPLWENLDLSKL